MNAKQALLGGVSALAMGAGLLVPAPSFGQQAQGTINTQSGFKADAATFFAGTTFTGCTTTQHTVAGLTITITPPAGNYVYLTNLNFQVSQNATAATSATVWTSTNLTGSPAWITPVVASSASVPTSQYAINEIYPTGLKSTAPGTAVTIVPSATTASTYICAQVVGFYSPS